MAYEDVTLMAPIEIFKEIAGNLCYDKLY